MITKRTLFIRRTAPVDGTIRMNGKVYLFRYHCTVPLTGRKMVVWVMESPQDLYSLTERLVVYSESVPSNESFIGCADFTPTI